MKNTELEQLINDKLNSAAISDYAPNGLQVEGKETVHKIVTGVTASQALLDEAVRLQADAVIVHHGYFWKGESPVIRGMKRTRKMKNIVLIGSGNLAEALARAISRTEGATLPRSSPATRNEVQHSP